MLSALPSSAPICLVLFLLRGCGGALLQPLRIFVPEAMSGAAAKDVLQSWLAEADRVDLAGEGLDHVGDKAVPGLALDANAAIVEHRGSGGKARVDGRGQFLRGVEIVGVEQNHVAAEI